MSEAKHSDIGRKVARGATIALAAIGAGLGARAIHNNSPVDASSPTPTFRPTETMIPPVSSQELDGVTIYYGQNGLPNSYKLQDKTYYLPSDQIEKMKALAKKARDDKEPELLLNIQSGYYQEPAENWQTSPARPNIEKLPPDVMSDSELEKKGVIQIIQGQNVNLFIRKEAFDKGGILYNLLQAQSLKNSKNHIKLRIVLVDGPTVSADYMGDPKYDDVRTMGYLRNQGPYDFRKEQIDGFTKELENALNNLHLAQAKNDNIEAINVATWQVIRLKNQIDNYTNASFDQLIEKINLANTQEAGLYFSPQANDKGQKVATVFVAVGSTLPIQENVKLYATPDGSILATNDLGIGNYIIDYRPDASKGFPKKTDFTFYPGVVYPYGAQKNEAGQILTHELEHFRLISLLPLLKGVTPDFSETHTDIEAVEQIEREYEAWTNSGTNQLKNPYPFVFQEGGIIQVTENDQESPTNY